MAYLDKLRVLFFKIESTPYTAETSFAATDSLPCENIEFNPDIAIQERKTAFGDFSYCSSVAGKRGASIKFDMPVYHSGTNATAPKYFELLRACGLKQTTYAGTGVGLTSDCQYTDVPISIIIEDISEGTSPTVKKHSFRGCMGNPIISGGAVGEYSKISFEFKGIYDSIEDVEWASYTAPSFSCYAPEVILGVGCTLNSVSQGANTFTINLNNEVELFTDLTDESGYSGAHIVGRHPTIELDPDTLDVDDEDLFSQVTDHTLMAFSLEFNNPILITAPKCQLVDMTQGSREGHSVVNKKLECQRDSGNDELEILHGSKS